MDFLPALSGVFKGVLFGVLLSLCLATDVGVFNGVRRVLLRFGVFQPKLNNSEPLLTTSSSSLLPPSKKAVLHLLENLRIIEMLEV